EDGIRDFHVTGVQTCALPICIHKIRESVSHMLVLFPFEEEIYQKEGVPVTYVGHPLAEVIPMEPDKAAARRYLGVDPGARVLAQIGRASCRERVESARGGVSW